MNLAAKRGVFSLLKRLYHISPYAPQLLPLMSTWFILSTHSIHNFPVFKKLCIILTFTPWQGTMATNCSEGGFPTLQFAPASPIIWPFDP